MSAEAFETPFTLNDRENRGLLYAHEVLAEVAYCFEDEPRLGHLVRWVAWLVWAQAKVVANDRVPDNRHVAELDETADMIRATLYDFMAHARVVAYNVEGRRDG